MAGRGGFRPGSGRKPGSLNKPKISLGELIMSARHACEKRNYDPFMKLITLANHKDATVSDLIKINATLASYVAPQLKSIEHTGDALGQPVTVTLDPYMMKDVTPKPKPSKRGNGKEPG